MVPDNTQDLVVMIIAASVAAMLLLGAVFIGATVLMRPRMQLRRRIQGIGVIGGNSESPTSYKAEGRRQKRIQ